VPFSAIGDHFYIERKLKKIAVSLAVCGIEGKTNFALLERNDKNSYYCV
jgi:hypothetical protein